MLHEVMPGLYVGSLAAVGGLLREHNITAVLSVQPEDCLRCTLCCAVLCCAVLCVCVCVC